MTGLTEKQLHAAVTFVRDPHRLEDDIDRMDLFELGARRFLAYLQKNGYTIAKARGQQ